MAAKAYKICESGKAGIIAKLTFYFETFLTLFPI